MSDRFLHHRYQHREWGGTLIGVVLGVLVGLAAAVAVAMYVSKVPVPFVDRAISRTPAQDAAEQERNKDWNPNAALIGKPPKPTATDSSTTPSSSPPTKADGAPPTVEATSPPPDKPVKPAPTETAVTDPPKPPPPKVPSPNDPLGDLAKLASQGKPVASNTNANTSVEPIQYFVQVGAFHAAEDAQAQRAKMAMMGLDARITEREQAGRTVFRVRLGPFERLDEAEKLKTEVHSGGVEAALVRVQR